MSVGKWHMSVYVNERFETLLIFLSDQQWIQANATYRQVASQKITSVLVVWNSRVHFPIEILLLIAIRFPG